MEAKDVESRRQRRDWMLMQFEGQGGGGSEDEGGGDP